MKPRISISMAIWLAFSIIMFNSMPPVYGLEEEPLGIVSGTAAIKDDISEATRNYFSGYDVELNENTRFQYELKNCESNNDKAIFELTVINEENRMITADSMLYIGNREAAEDLYATACKALFSTRDNGYKDVDFPPAGVSGNEITVHARAVYYKYYVGILILIQPQGAYFTYQKNTSCSVSKIQVLYGASGAKYTYPGGSMYSLYDEYTAWITKYNPVQYTAYSNYSPYNSNYALDTDIGMTGSHYLTFWITVDGIEHSGTVPLIGV